LVATGGGAVGTQASYFSTPTPGALNSFGAADTGPLIIGVGHGPETPATNQELRVTARVLSTFNPVAEVTLHYRVMFAGDVSLAMNDRGADGDAVAGDGIWSGNIPAGAAANGQMIRYYVSASDVLNNSSRSPLFADPANSEQYLGTVATDPGIQSSMPVVQVFGEKT